MSRIPGNTNGKRFPSRKENGKWFCRMCGAELSGRKTSFCGRRCLRDFFMLTDWRIFGHEVEALCKRLRRNYYIKEDLRKAMG